MRLRPGNAQHQGAREAQQDSFGFSDLEDATFVEHAGFLGIVADGMGGLAHGGAASATAVRTLLQTYGVKRADHSIPGALLNALHRANQAVIELAPAAGEPEAIGTTAAAVIVHDTRLYWIAVGDTRVYLWRAGGLTQVTADHVYARDLAARVAEGRMREEDARADPDRDALTSHLGLAPLPAVDRSVRPFPLLYGDRVLVCSDGLYRALSIDELAAPLAGRPQPACEQLVALAMEKRLPKQDNLTVIVIAADLEDDTRTGDEVSVA